MGSSQTKAESGERGSALLSRRTTLLGVAGVTGGGLLGYRAFLSNDEPAFAFSNLELTGEGVTIDTIDGGVESVFIDGSETEIAYEYINFQESQVGDGEDEFGVELDLEVNEDHLTASPETIFETAIDAGELPADEITNELEADLGVESLDIDDHSEIDLEDFEPDDGVGESLTTTLEFTLQVEAESYEDVSGQDEVDLDVTVTTVDEDDIEVEVGGHIVLDGEAENAPAESD